MSLLLGSLKMSYGKSSSDIFPPSFCFVLLAVRLTVSSSGGCCITSFYPSTFVILFFATKKKMVSNIIGTLMYILLQQMKILCDYICMYVVYACMYVCQHTFIHTRFVFFTCTFLHSFPIECIYDWEKRCDVIMAHLMRTSIPFALLVWKKSQKEEW